MSNQRKKQASFVDRVLDGVTRIDAFPSEVRAWQNGDQKQPLHTALGLDADELLLVAKSPDALRYVLFAKRFNRDLSEFALDTQARVNATSMQIASEHMDLYLLAEIEEWRAKEQPDYGLNKSMGSAHA